MTLKERWLTSACALVAVNVVLISCSETSSAPAKGTPAFYWAAARETSGAGDYLKTIENLDRIVATDNEYTAKARPWLLILESGLARGYMDEADYYEAGARAHKADPTPFRKQVSNSRGAASRLALGFAEAFEGMQKVKDDNVVLAFPYPTGSAAYVPVLAKVGNGILPAAGEVETAQRSALTRAVLLATCRAAGAPDDTARTQAMFKGGDVKVPRATFVMAMAAALHDEAQLFSRQKLDQPEKLKVFCQRAQDALKGIPACKESKELNTKIEATLKRAKA